MSSSAVNSISGTEQPLCLECGAVVSLPPDTKELFAAWTPQRCHSCQERPAVVARPVTATEILATIPGDAESGVYVSGSCEPRGAGGWGVVRVLSGAILTESSGAEDYTTSNRMEIEAVLQGLQLIGPKERATLHTRSQLAVSTLRIWAPAWERTHWRRGVSQRPIANLDLVRAAFDLYVRRPNVTLDWLPEKPRRRWAEYAHALSRQHLVAA